MNLNPSNSDSKYWFPAKRYGWGWGLPCAWQGWVVFISFIALLAAGAFVIPPKVHPIGYAVYSMGLSKLLIVICFAKGEPPQWRWKK